MKHTITPPPPRPDSDAVNRWCSTVDAHMRVGAPLVFGFRRASGTRRVPADDYCGEPACYYIVLDGEAVEVPEAAAARLIDRHRVVRLPSARASEGQHVFRLKGYRCDVLRVPSRINEMAA